jgi:hypothetical protein
MKSSEGPTATLPDEIRAGLDIRAICLECQHTSVLSSRELAKRLGEAFPVRRLIGRLCCHKCHGKNVDVIVHQPNATGPVAGHGPSQII